MTTAVFHRLAAALAAFGLLFTVGMATAKAPDNDTMPKVLAQSVDAGRLEVKNQFDTEVPGLTGYLVKTKGQDQYEIVYGDHGYLIMGHVISPEGNNLSSEYSQKYIPKPDIAKIVDQVKASGHLVQQGPDNAPLIYAFADPNCIYCHTLYERAKPLVDAGKLQIQWVLVGFLSPTSMGRSAAILSADDPTAALAENEKGFDEETENGAIKPLDDPSDEIKKAINTPAQLMAASGGTGTPTLLYRNEDGQWDVMVGAPTSNWLKNLANQSS